MNYRIELGSAFKQKFKQLRKKYHSLDKDLAQLAGELRQNPTAGADLGNGVRKVRMALSDKGRGKSHGARVITLLAIYDKADRDSISDKEIARLIQEI